MTEAIEPLLRVRGLSHRFPAARDERYAVRDADLDLFAGEVVGREGGVEHEIGQQIERGRDVLVEHLDVEADGLFAGKGVEVSADRVDLAGELLGGTRGRALEHHVLDEVGDTVDFRGFVA